MLSSLSHAQLADCRRLFLSNYHLDANVGVYDYEKVGAQRTAISVDVFVPLAISTPVNDQISEVVDYDFIRDIIRSRISAGHIDLLETICDDVARRILAHPLVRAVRVSTMKRDIYPDCDGVGVEVIHIKEEGK